jgi:hypothetical protein
MALNPRQNARYNAVVSLYKPGAQATTGLGKRATDQAFGTTAAYTGVRCAYRPTPNQSYDELPGRTLRQQVFTLDKFEFEAAQEIADGWVIELTGWNGVSTGNYHPDKGKVWTTLGDPQTVASAHGRQPNYQMILARIGVDQPGM